MEYTNSQIRDLIKEHIHSERDRRLMYKRLVDGVGLEKLGEMFGLTRRQVWNIVKKNENILFRYVK